MTDLDQCAERVGTTVRDKWKLERLLGVGGMAAVYVAVHKIGRRDAIKILHTEISTSPEVRARFEQEALAVNRFKHPGAVEVRDIDVTEDGAPFLVMELLEGETLSRIGRREPGPSIDDVLRWADELLDVLAAAHAQGIVHRDIKPDNLFVTTEGRLKVLDFGIARLRSGATRGMRTATGATLGTVSYMPPEQAKGADIDARADLFAVGATMFRLIAKRRVHEADNDYDLLKKMATEPAPSLASVAPAAPEAVCRIVDRALQFERDARYRDAAAMQADVRAARGLAPSALAASVAAPLAAPPVSLASPPAPPAALTSPAPPAPPPSLASPASSHDAPTVGRPRPPSEAVAPVVAARPEATLRSGPASETAPSPPPPPSTPIAPPASAPPASAPLASAPPAAAPASGPATVAPQDPRARANVALVAGLVVVALALIAGAVLIAALAIIGHKPAASADDAASTADADVPDPSAEETPAPTGAAASTHKPTAAPTKTAPAPMAPGPTPPQKSHGGGHNK